MSTTNRITVTTPTQPTVTVNDSGGVDINVAFQNITGGGSGDVVGPSSSTDNAIARFSGTSGKVIQNSGITIADGATGTLSGSNSGDVTLGASVTDIFNLTGQVLSADDQGADRIVFWDDSESKLTALTAGSGLSISGTTITATATGDVVGPASSTDNALVRFDGTTGKLVQNGQITESDTGDLAAINSLAFDTTPTGSLTTQGQMMWNADDETLDIQLNDFTLHIGEQTVYHVTNSTGSTIAKGVPVMYAGTTGNSGRLLVQPWDGVGPTTFFLGLMAEDLSNNEEGFVVGFGKLRGIQTDGANYGETWADGDVIYAGTTTGSLTKTAPSAPNPIVEALAVVHAHASNGTVFVRPAYILGDVFGPASSVNNDVALFDGTTGKLVKDGGTFPSLVASSTNGATSKTTPVDADEIPLTDSAASYVLKKLTWANLKAAAKTYFDTLYQPLASILTAFSGLANSAGLLTNNGSGTLSYTPTTTGGNGVADSGKVPLLNSEGGLELGSYSNTGGNNLVTLRNGIGNGLNVGLDTFGYGVYSELNGAGSVAFHGHVTSLATGNNVAFQGDVTGGSGVNYLLQGVANSTGYLVHGYEYMGGLQYDRLTINAQGALTWYKNGTTLTSGTDKTTLTYATPSGTNTITLPAATGTVLLSGGALGTPSSGTLTSCTGLPISTGVSGLGTNVAASLANAMSASGTLAILGANTFTATQTVTPAANTSGLVVSGYSLTGSSTTALLNLSGAWNTTGIAEGLFLNITNTASNAASRLLRLQASGVDRFAVAPTGGVTLRHSASANDFISIGGTSNMVITAQSNSYGIHYQLVADDGSGAPSFRLASGGSIEFNSTTTLTTGSRDLFIRRGAAGLLSQHNSTNAQAFRVANTFTSATNFEAFTVDWQTTSNVCRVGTIKGSGGGTARALSLITDATVRAVFEATTYNTTLLAAAGSYGSGSGVLFLGNATTAPTTDPTGGGILYVEAGALKYRGSSGTVTTIANA